MQSEDDFSFLLNKMQNLLKKMSENKTQILKESEKCMEAYQIFKEVESLENSFKELYLKKVLQKNDRDFQTNKVFEGFQNKINDLNKNPLKQKCNELIKRKKQLETEIQNSMKKVIIFQN